MSMERTALRLSVERALLADPVVTAICENRIFDSRMQDFKAGEPVPVVIMTTEQAKGEAWGENNGGPPFNNICALTFEIALRSTEIDDRGDLIGYGTPVTDRELEAILDMLETRISWVMAESRTPEAELVRKVLRRIARYESERFTTDDTAEKLAIRLVTLHVELIGEEPRASWDVPPGDFNLLPDPLRTVCAAMPEGSSGYLTCKLIESKFPPRTIREITRTPATIGLVVSPQNLSPQHPDPIPLADDPPAVVTTVPLD